MLKKLKGKNDKEDPKSLIATASFLDMLVRRESRNLDNGNMIVDDFILSIKDRFMTYLLSLPTSEAAKLLDFLKEKIEKHDKNLAHL